jgi:hypothetical protein
MTNYITKKQAVSILNDIDEIRRIIAKIQITAKKNNA